MILRKRFVAVSIILISGLLLSGCNYSIQKVTPTVDPVILQATVDAAVAQVVQATAYSLTSTAAAMPTNTSTSTATVEPTATATATATATPEPTATATIVIPTATNTYIPPTQKPSATATPVAYVCSLVSVSPASGTKMSTGNDFDVVWKVRNSGSKDWQPGYVDLVYVSGTKMQTKGDAFDINISLAKGAETTVALDMLAPSSARKYTESFQLVMEGIVMCTLPVTIEAVAP